MQASVDIIRKGNALIKLSIALPVWTKERDDNLLSVFVPMLNIETSAKDENDVQVALTEVLTLFVDNCEKQGSGIENELKIAGWNFTNQSKDKTSMCWGTDDEVIERIMTTGNDFAHTIEFTV